MYSQAQFLNVKIKIFKYNNRLKKFGMQKNHVYPNKIDSDVCTLSLLTNFSDVFSFN